MKALGKGSIASLLAIGLHVARVILFCGFVGLVVAAIVLPFVPLLGRIFAGNDHVNIDGAVDAGDFLKVFYHLITFGVMLSVVNRLLEILRTLRFGSPFVKENAVRFQHVGFALLIGESAKIIFSIVSTGLGADLDVDIDLFTWVGIAAVFVLAELFHEGAKMKEEQDLTV